METSSAIKVLAALAQETRLEVFRLLVKAGVSGMAAGEISDTLGLPRPTLSFHLKELVGSGVIDSTREGRSIRYFLDPEAMRDFLGFLSQDCCQGHPEICVPFESATCSTSSTCES